MVRIKNQYTQYITIKENEFWINIFPAQSGRAVEYVDCTSTELYDSHQ